MRLDDLPVGCDPHQAVGDRRRVLITEHQRARQRLVGVQRRVRLRGPRRRWVIRDQVRHRIAGLLEAHLLHEGEPGVVERLRQQGGLR